MNIAMGRAAFAFAVAATIVLSAESIHAQTADMRGVERIIAPSAPALSLPNGGKIYAVVVGVDDYKVLPKLRGAVADAQDIERTLRRAGVTDITAMFDRAATRDAITQTMTRLGGVVQSGDVVIFSYAGHGSQEPALKPTRENGGYDETYVLANFEPTGPATAERILDKEVYRWLAAFEAKGASVILVADSCHSGGMSKNIDPRIGPVSVRSVKRVDAPEKAVLPDTYYIRSDRLPTFTGAVAGFEGTSTDDFKRLTFVAAVDKWTLAPEIKIPSEPTMRGAVSYAFARAIEGKADSDLDGKITRRELIGFVRALTADLTERGQQPVLAPLDRLDETLLTVAPSQAQMTLASAASTGASVLRPQPSPAPSQGQIAAPSAEPPLRVRIAGGAAPDKGGVGPVNTAFEWFTPAPGIEPDAVYDLARGDVVSALGDVVATRIPLNRLGGVIDRLGAVRKLAAVSTKSNARLHLVPDRRLYKAKDVVSLQVKANDARFLVIANITGDGKIQFVYPLKGDDPMVMPPPSGAPKILGEVAIKPPFGSDVMVTVASKRRLTALEEQLLRRNDQQGAVEFVKLVESLATPDMEVSFLSFFTEQ